MDLLDDMDKKLLKSLLNEEWRGEDGKRAGKGRNEGGGQKTRAGRRPLYETKARGGKSRREEDRSRRQDSRFDRSMRVLEWLDADCGTRLARHYEQAGGWRHHSNIYLSRQGDSPKRAQESQREQTTKKATSPQHPQQQKTRQPLRLTRSNIIINTDLWSGYVKDSEEDSSEGEEEKKILEECEEDLTAEEDLVESLKKWQQEQLLLEHHEDLSMQDYVTSSEEDAANEDESDSEDELVLALRHWQEEQQRQQLRQAAALAQNPQVLTPVLEEKTSSPLNEAFKYFYQDPNYLLCHFNRQRLKNHQQVSGIAPYWWGDISSVREGPSSPPVNAKNLDATQPCNILTIQRRSSRKSSLKNRLLRTQDSVVIKEVDISANSAQENTEKPPASVAPSNLLSPSPKIESVNKPQGGRGKAPSPLPSPLDTSGTDAKPSGALENILTRVSPTAIVGPFVKGVDDGGLKITDTSAGGLSPHSPLVRSPGGNFLSTWLVASPGDKQGSHLSGSTDYLGKSSECLLFESPREPLCSTNSQDSGIERSPGYLSPAPRSAGIEKIGKFFRHFSNKLSPASTSSNSTPPKTPPPTPSGRQQYLYPAQQINIQGGAGKLSYSTSSIPTQPPSTPLLKAAPPQSPIAGVASQHSLCSATKSDPLAGSAALQRHVGLWRSGQKSSSNLLVTGGRSPANSSLISPAGENSQNVISGCDGAGTGGGGAIHRPAAVTGVTASSATTLTIDTLAAEACAGDRQRSPGGPNSGVSKTILSTREVQPFIVPQTYQHHYLHHQFSSPRKTAGEAVTAAAKRSEEGRDGGDVTEAGSQSNTRAAYKDNADSLRKSNEALDVPGADNETASGAGSGGGSNCAGLSGFTRGVQNFLRKSPVTDIEQRINSEIIERDIAGKLKSVLSPGAGGTCGGAFTSPSFAPENTCAVASSAATQGTAGGYNATGENYGYATAKSMTETSRRGAAKEEIISSERSSSTSSEEKGALPVPSGEHDRGRRGSYGTCNHLFLEQASGRKSPLPQKNQKSPSPVRRALFKSVVTSSNSSSSSSAESSKLHSKVGRVLSSSSPSSPPPHLVQQQSSPLKTSPKHQPNDALDSPTKKNICNDSPPANYRGRRKFSDTGLTPVPRRLFSDGRRGSLTDERTLVSAKSKLGKLRFQGRKSSDASSVAALVKQIHNLWGEGEEDEDEGERNIERRESGSGLKCSLDDQALFDKRRKKFPFSISREKDSTCVEKGGGNKINTSSCAPHSEASPAAVSDGKCKGKNLTDKDSALTLQPSSGPASAQSGSSVINSGDTSCQASDEVYQTGVNEGGSETASISLEAGGGGAVTGVGGIGNCGGAVGGSEFVAPIAQVASRQLVATAVSSAACFVGLDTSTDNILTRASAGVIGGSQIALAGSATVASNIKTNKKTATVQFEPIVSWDDNRVGEKVSPALRSVLKQGTRRHSSFAGFSDSCDSIANASPIIHSEQLAAVLNKQAKNGLPKSKTSDNYKSILKQSSVNLETVPSSTTEKKRVKSPSPKSRKHEKSFDYGQESKNSEVSLSLCLKATRSISPKSKKYRPEGKDACESSGDLATSPQNCSDREPQTTDSGHCSLDLPTKTVGVQATPRTIGKTSNTGTQTTDLPSTGEVTAEYSSSPTEAGGWLQRLAAKCMASVGGANRSGSPGGPGSGLPRAASVRAEWLLGSKRMGSSPSSPVAQGSDASEKFWVPHDVIARKRAQSLVPTLSKQESEDDLSSEAATPASIPHPRDLTFTFPGGERSGTSGGSSDGQPSTPPSGYNPGRRRASMHDAIDLSKIDTRLYDKKLVRQASVTSIEEECQGTVHVSMEHNAETGILTVNLVRVHNLLPRDPSGTANPYCRLTLLPGQRASAQSRIHRKTMNPEFEEEFIFELTSEELEVTTLDLSFYEYDQFSKDECIGYVRIPLARLDLSRQVDLWRTILPYEKPKDQRDLGDVMFSLSYLPSAERLTVVVVKARNLRLQDDGRVDLNSFIKVCLTSGSKKLKKKKTSTAHGTNSPTWNEALVFSVHRENLKNIGLEVSAYHDNKIGVDECIGRVRLPPDSEDGVHCQELLKEKSMPARWYSLS
ncbi:uncharacterized protein LOC106056338 [Biomphalaria glabrata]|uniref:Uncharacterized protein LOC106056338 n=1 Tax=Biomphalaria glabrata TaxID=6526 RepID=A0A9U8E0P8_BIOGL|nr:uncharacterized protein LOC106056338 [Biomphalaria glabrata]